MLEWLGWLFGREGSEGVQETIFPTAKETLEKTEKKWPTKTPEEILMGINKARDKGERYVTFFYSKISEETAKELRALGYTVKISTLYDGTPYFKVMW